MKNKKHLIMRIFPFLKCNFSCSYCTAYRKYAKPINLKRDIISAKDWLKAINCNNLYDSFDEKFSIRLSGGEPGLYKDLAGLCDGIEHRNIYIYSNISRQVFPRLLTLKKEIIFYPSFHVLEEKKDGSNYQEWYQRVYELKQKGHKIMMPHSPDDGSVGNLPVMKTKIEDMNYSPYLNGCRMNAKEIKKVYCFTGQYVIDSAGEIFNCQSGLWANDKSLSLGNIKNTKWNEIPKWFYCDQCGKCHVCSQAKVIKDLNGNIFDLDNEWQLKIKKQLEQEFQARQLRSG